MNKFVLVRTGFEHLTTTCDRCGKPIKWTYTAKDLVTGEEQTVGSTCIDKVLYIANEKTTKAIEKEIVKYSEELEEFKKYMEISIEEHYNKELNKDWYNKDYARNRSELYYNVIQHIVWKIEKMITTTKNINNGRLKNYIQLENLDDLINTKNDYNSLMEDIKENKLYLNEDEKKIDKIEIAERKAKKEAEKIEELNKIKETYIGLESEKVDLKEVELIEVESDCGYYGTTYFYTFKKDNYNLIWKTSKYLELEVNTVLNIKGTIKENRACQEGNFTYLTRCKIS